MIRNGDTFDWRGARLDYLDHPYNTTALNERAVEVPIALDFIDRHAGNGLEVGNVLGHYTGRADWRVVDLFERAPGVENLDVLDITGRVDWLVAISTLEHVHPDRPGASAEALERLLDLVRPGGAALVTVPFDQNAYLDGAILAGAFDATFERTFLYGETGWSSVAGPHWLPRRRPHVWPAALWVAIWER